MPLRMAITKVSGQGEQIVIDVSQWNGVTGEIVHKDIEEMSVLFNQAMDLADCRLLEMNTRMLEAYKLRDYFDAEHWQKVISLFDILAGRADVTTVKQRWDDTLEENRELAAQREVGHTDCSEQWGVFGDEKPADTDVVCKYCYEKGGYHCGNCQNYTSNTESV